MGCIVKSISQSRLNLIACFLYLNSILGSNVLAVIVEAVNELFVSIEENHVRSVAVRGQRMVGHQAGGDAVFGGTFLFTVLGRVLA